MVKYEVLLLSPDGEDYQTEGSCDTVDEAIEISANMGSRWFFYPFHFIIRQYDKNYHNLSEIDKQRVIVAPDDFPALKNRTIKTVRKWLAENGERDILEYNLAGILRS